MTTPTEARELAQLIRAVCPTADFNRAAAMLTEYAALLEQMGQARPVAWIEGPHGAIRANPLWRLDPMPPQTVEWSIPLYAAPVPAVPRLTDELLKALRDTEFIEDGKDKWGYTCTREVVDASVLREFARAIERKARGE